MRQSIESMLGRLAPQATMERWVNYDKARIVVRTDSSRLIDRLVRPQGKSEGDRRLVARGGSLSASSLSTARRREAISRAPESSSRLAMFVPPDSTHRPGCTSGHAVYG